MDGFSANQFQCDHKENIPAVQDLLTLNILLYDIDIVDANFIGELADDLFINTKILCDY